MKKNLFLVTLALFLTTGLVACGNNNEPDPVENENNEPIELEEEEIDNTPDEANGIEEDEVIDGPGHASSHGGITDGNTLSEVLGAHGYERAWVAGLGSDLHMEGPLVIEGNVERHSAGEWSGVYARKLGLYQRDTINGLNQVPIGAWTLTVDEGIIVNSPNAFFISDGPFMAEIHGDVHVNIPYFRLSGVRIHGDIIFANEEYRDSAVWQIWDPEVAEVREGDDEDYDTDVVLYQSNSGFATYGPLSSADPTLNISNTEPSNLVTGEIRIAE